MYFVNANYVVSLKRTGKFIMKKPNEKNNMKPRKKIIFKFNFNCVLSNKFLPVNKVNKSVVIILNTKVTY